MNDPSRDMEGEMGVSEPSVPENNLPGGNHACYFFYLWQTLSIQMPKTTFIFYSSQGIFQKATKHIKK